MADNAQKRGLVNRAMLILNTARISKAKVFFDGSDTDSEISDAEFTDPYSVANNLNDKKISCFAYENILLMVLAELQPKFAKIPADLGAEVRVNKEFGNWSYLFGLPSDYDPRLRELVKQISQNSKRTEFDFDVLHFESYAHIVNGDDDQTYYCSTDHVSADDTSDGKPPTNDGNSNWTLYDTGAIGAPHSVYSYAYKKAATGDLLATNTYTNDPSATVDNNISSAYIEYIPYTQAGINDKPEYYQEHFTNAFCTRLAAEIAMLTKDYERRRFLMDEYDRIAKPKSRKVQQSRVYRKPYITVFEKRTR